jgi:hypothetical protein
VVGGSLNLPLHFHAIVADGVIACDDARHVRFHGIAPPARLDEGDDDRGRGDAHPRREPSEHLVVRRTASTWCARNQNPCVSAATPAAPSPMFPLALSPAPPMPAVPFFAKLTPAVAGAVAPV